MDNNGKRRWGAKIPEEPSSRPRGCLDVSRSSPLTRRAEVTPLTYPPNYCAYYHGYR